MVTKTSHPKGLGSVFRSVGDFVASQWRIDQLDIVPSTGNLKLLRPTAWLCIALVWSLGWLPGTISAFSVLLGRSYHATPLDSGPSAVRHQLFGLVVDVIVIALAATFMFLFHGRGFVRPHWKAGVATIPFATLAMALGFLAWGIVSAVLGITANNYPWPTVHGAMSEALYVVGNITPGPTEELALCGLVVVTLRRTGYAWWVVITVAVLVRLPFHLYYGWGAIALAVWPILTVLIYRRSGALWGIVVAHAAWDVTAGLTANAPHEVWVAVMTMGAFAIALTALARQQPAERAS